MVAKLYQVMKDEKRWITKVPNLIQVRDLNDKVQSHAVAGS